MIFKHDESDMSLSLLLAEYKARFSFSNTDDYKRGFILLSGPH
jgi:hypothetical protein